MKATLPPGYPHTNYAATTKDYGSSTWNALAHDAIETIHTAPPSQMAGGLEFTPQAIKIIKLGMSVGITFYFLRLFSYFVILFDRPLKPAVSSANRG